MSKHYQPYESPDQAAPAANSQMPPYPGRLATPQPAPQQAQAADAGAPTDRLKWIAVAALFVLVLAVVAGVIGVTIVQRKLADAGDSAPAAAAQMPRNADGAHSSLFEDTLSDGDDPLKSFDLDDSLASADEPADMGGDTTDAVVTDNRGGRGAVSGSGTVRSDVRFNPDARPEPRNIGPAQGSRTTPTYVKPIVEAEDNPKVALNIYQPGQTIPVRRNEYKPQPQQQPQQQMQPQQQQQDPNTIRNGNGVLAMPQGYNGPMPQMQPQQQQQMQPQQPMPQQPQYNNNYGNNNGNGGYYNNNQPQMQPQQPMPQQPMQPWNQQPNQPQSNQQPMPFGQQAWNNQPPAPAWQQQQMQPQQQQPMPQQPQMQQQQQMPPAAQLDPYANAAGSPTNANQAPPSRPASAPSSSSDFGRGLALQQAGDHERAIEYYKRALDSNPNHFGAYNNLGVVYRQQGKYDQAIQVLSEALALHPQDTRVANNLAGCYIKTQQFNQAERVLRQAISADPSDLAAMTNLGIVYTAMHKYRDAEMYLNNAVQQHPQEPKTYYNLGNLYRRMGRSEAAMRNYLRFLEVSRGRHPQQESQVRRMLGNTGSWR